MVRIFLNGSRRMVGMKENLGGAKFCEELCALAYITQENSSNTSKLIRVRWGG